MYRTVSRWLALDKQMVRLYYWCDGLWRSCLLFGFDAVWSRNLTLICCPRTLKCHGYVFMFVECMEKTVSYVSAPDKQEVCLNWCDEAVICVRCSMASLSHPDVLLSKYTTIIMSMMTPLLRLLCSLNVCNVVVMVLDEQDVRLYSWCMCFNLMLLFVFDTVWGLNLTWRAV